MMFESKSTSTEEETSIEQKFIKIYRSFFSIQEIEEKPILQWAFGALLLGLFVTFYGWVNSGEISASAARAGEASCWPYFQNCDFLYIFEALPHYSQTTLYAVFYCVMLLVIYFMWRKQWVWAHMGLLTLFLWKIFVMFAVSSALAGNYDYYDIIIGTVLLFFPHKEKFAKLTFVFLYFLAGTIKIHEGWITASYFTSLVGGLAWFGDTFAPLATNIVIFEQIVGSWFLLSKNIRVQRTALAFFVFFHFYSIVFVTYRYPSSALTMLLALFGPQYRFTPLPFDKRAIVGWLFIILLIFLQFLPKLIAEDQRWTLEANQFGLNMFEANHQCRSQVFFELDSGERVSSVIESRKAWDRCNPYHEWLRIHKYCEHGGVVRARWMFDHSVNGHPFYRMIDVENACLLSYKPLSHNEWIRTPEEGALPVGRPLQNPYSINTLRK